MVKHTVHLIDKTRTPSDLMTACGRNTRVDLQGHERNNNLRTVSSPLLFEHDFPDANYKLCERCMGIWRSRDLEAAQSTPVKLGKDPRRDSVRYGGDEEFQAVIGAMDIKDLPDAFIGLTTQMLYQLAEGLGLKVTLVIQPKERS